MDRKEEIEKENIQCQENWVPKIIDYRIPRDLEL